MPVSGAKSTSRSYGYCGSASEGIASGRMRRGPNDARSRSGDGPQEMSADYCYCEVRSARPLQRQPRDGALRTCESQLSSAPRSTIP
eukprot:6050825-Prymnesium_polylepis.2